VASGAFYFNTFPNPVRDKGTIQIYLTNDQFVNLSVFHISGALFAELLNKNMKKGEHRLSLNLSSASAGNYFVRMVSAFNGTHLRPVIKI
jgi:hypothetical protein